MMTANRIKCALVVGMAGLMAVLAMCHVHGVNGPWYWHWTWRRLAWGIYPAMFLAAAPFAAGQYLYARRGWRAGRALMLVALTTVLLELTALAFQPPGGLGRIRVIVESPAVTSYFTAATFVKDTPANEWLQIYPDFIQRLMIHARFKPPGLILYYWALIRLFGMNHAALIGGFIIIGAAAASVFATYGLVRHFSDGDVDAALGAASFFALCPSLVLIAPQFDQVYPAMTCVLLILWSLAVKTGWLRYGIATGAWLALALFCSYIFLIFGLMMAVMAMLHAAERRWPGVIRCLVQSLIVAAVVLLVYLGLWALVGYDALATHHVIAEGEAADLVLLSRPFPYHIPFDFLDLALGTGWISFLLVLFYVVRARKELLDLFHQSPGARLAFLALLEIGVVIVSALLPGEGARLFLPLMPLLMAPIGLELSRWSPRQRMVVYVCLLVMTCVICQNMIFLYAGPEIDGVVR